MADRRPLIIEEGVIKESQSSSSVAISSSDQALTVSNPSDSVFVIGFDAELSKVPNLKLQFEAGETISALKVVRVDLNGKAYISNNEGTFPQAMATGIALNSALSGFPVDVIILGVLVDPSWNWSANNLIFLDVNGSIVSTAPTLGYSVRLGKTLTPTAVLIDIQEPIEL